MSFTTLNVERIWGQRSPWNGQQKTYKAFWGKIHFEMTSKYSTVRCLSVSLCNTPYK